MIRIVAAAAAIAVGATLVFAQNLEVIKQRRAAMKATGTAVGDQDEQGRVVI
jgi:hypothetical protein